MTWLRIFRRRSQQAGSRQGGQTAAVAGAEPPSPTPPSPTPQPPTSHGGDGTEASAITPALNAFLNAPNWAETRAVLEREQRLLLGDAAIARLQEVLADARKSGAGESAVLLELHLGLLQAARTQGIPAAWDQFLASVQQRQAATNALGPVLISWLNAGSARAARRFLEAHPELLRPETEMLFDPLVKQYGGQGDALNSLAIHHALLRQARARGGAPAAIRDAYVDIQGGLALDVPEWLEEVERQTAALEAQGQTGQPALERARLWQDALTRAAREPGLAPEIVAALQQSLWEALYYAGADGTQEPGIAALEAALAVYSRERYPIQWAMVQSNLGRMLIDRAQGDRAANIERAIACLAGALQVFTPEQFPLQWATTQDNLGNAYRVRPAGERAENLERALGCFEATLAVYSREAFAGEWANAQNNLGLVYADRIRGDRADNVERSIGSYQAALDVYTRDAYPAPWAMLQNNLGIAYRNRVRGDAAENQERALECYTAALQVRTRDAFPADWAATQNNLGRLYVDRIRGERAANVEQAIACFEAALAVRTRAAMPAQWALTQNNLGDAYLARIHGDRSESIERALACYNDALSVYTRASYPDDWAATRRNLAGAYAERIAGDRASNMEEAIGHYGKALEVYTRNAYPLVWAQVTMELGNAYQNRVRGEVADNIERALACYGDALTVLTREAFPADWAAAQLNLSAAYFQRVRGERADDLEQALQHVTAAQEIYTREAFPADWAGARYNLGQIYTNRIRGDHADNVERALACYADTLGVYGRDTYPAEWARTQLGQGSAYRARLRGTRADNLEQAIACDMAALDVYTRDAFPADWALAQNNLGIGYADRIQGDRADNIERAIQCYQAALEVRTREALPLDWAATQLNLGVAYSDRIREARSENLERAIQRYIAALDVFTRDAVPQLWAQVQNNLGTTYQARELGERGENIEKAILSYQAALEVYTRDGAPVDWARMQNNLGDAYYSRIQGDREDNIERALTLFRAAQEVYTREAFPTDWTLARRNQGRAYLRRVAGDPRGNLEQAIGCFEDALEVYSLAALPREWASTQVLLGNVYADQLRAGLASDPAAASGKAVGYYKAALSVYTRAAAPLQFRRVSIQLAEAEAQRRNWEAAHAAYEAAHQAEEALVALSAGARGRDVVLQLVEGRESGTRDGFVLFQLGRPEEALLAVERARARGLAEMHVLQSADPARISDAARRSRYLEARDHLLDAQAAANHPPPDGLPEEERLQGELARSSALHEAQAQLDAVVEEIRAARDPADFLRDTLDMATIWRAASAGPTGHSLVYLLATPWGGLALGALGGNSTKSTTNRVAALALPALTSDLVSDLIQSEKDGISGKVIGGFGHAQEGRGFSFLDHGWPGTTFAEKAASLHAECAAAGRESMLDRAAQDILTYPAIAALATRPLGPAEYAQLDPTFEFAYLRHELRRCLPKLAEVALRPVVAWLRQAEVASVTFIPTGALATFPLLDAPLGEARTPADASGWEMVGDALAATVAPSARALLALGTSAADGAAESAGRAGVATLGDPRPTHQALQWGEAEALTLAKIGGDASRVRIHEQATRDWLVGILGAAEVVDACCHGEFDPLDFLRSRLLLANGETLTLGEMLGGATQMAGLRLLILSACQTAILDLRGARDEVRSLAAGMLQAGARAVLGAQWSVDDKATYLLMARFAQEWFPNREREAPAAALARAKRWLRGVTNRELHAWEETVASGAASGAASNGGPAGEQLAVRGGGTRYGATEAAERVSAAAADQSGDARPFADPIFWSAFQLTGW